ncbi:hypothetical protein [Pedobacter arcticus]|uniref:hypothetical protein n=1 Tax=Pedobacter arcticus TaxID=752140 RepID=UPI0002EE5177|nr:hypothetical protein [Pedobacter arcticus]
MDNNLKEIKATIKTGAECISNNGVSTQFSLLDFWRWSVSDILSNATRGRFAEFIVATAVGGHPATLRDEWDAYDFISEEGIKIEVKSAAYIQSWNQKALSPISFSIKKAKVWDLITDMRQNEPSRHADVYVFCHLKHIDQDTIDPLKMEQWDFYVLPTSTLNNYTRSQHSITLNSLIKLAPAKTYAELSEAVSDAYIDHLQAIK